MGNPSKAASNVRKHGVTFEEGFNVFRDRLADIRPDLAHEEERFVMVGRPDLSSDRLLVVVFTEVEEDVAHIISVRVANKRERKRYEEAR